MIIFGFTATNFGFWEVKNNEICSLHYNCYKVNTYISIIGNN